MPERSSERRRALKLGAAMLLAIVAVATLAWLDEKRESATALDDFAQEQASLAASVATELEGRLRAARQDALMLADDEAAQRPSSGRILGNYLDAQVGPDSKDRPQGRGAAEGFSLEIPIGSGKTVRLNAAPSELLAGLSSLQRPNALVLFVAPPGEAELRSTDGRRIRSPELLQALAQGRSTTRLAGPSAAELGLPERTAMAGLARVNAGPLGTWGVAAVASAERVRDREQRARARLILAVALASGMVLGFGGFARRQQRKELELERELAVAELTRERDERLSRLNKAATMVTMASGVAHEISTPLGVIAGRAEQLASRAAGDERSQRCVAAILDQTERIKQIIRGFLDLARGGSPTLQQVKPLSVVQEAVALVEHRFDNAGVHLETRVPDGLPLVHCDQRLLEHALVNLLLNACDACARNGRVVLSVGADAVGVSFDVTDDGQGIAAANLSRVTEPFFTTKPNGKGTGLGLAIANEIAKGHRGTLSLEPLQPHGTRARVQIPLAQQGVADA